MSKNPVIHVAPIAPVNPVKHASRFPLQSRTYELSMSTLCSIAVQIIVKFEHVGSKQKIKKLQQYTATHTQQ